MGERECPQKRAEYQMRTMMPSNILSPDGVSIVTTTGLEGEMPDLSCEPDCNGPTEMARHRFSVLRIFGDTYDVCPVETNVAMPTAPSETQ